MTKKKSSGPTPRKPRHASAKSPSPHTRRNKAAPEDDNALWSAYAKGIDPLDLKGRVPDTDRDLIKDMLRQEAAQSNRKPPPGPQSDKSNTTPKKSPPQKPPTPPPVNQIDARQVRRIGTGRDGIDARIDLHGMRQHEAHGALRAFLFRSVARGHRMVLVITGKGLSRPDDSNHFGSFINEGPLGRGVLRRNVPLWLAESDLRAIVVGHTPAHIRHGGDGALYVQLRRRKRA